MKIAIYIFLFITTPIMAQSVDPDLSIEAVDNSFIPINIFGLSRVHFQVINHSNNLKGINMGTRPLVEIKSGNLEEWKSGDEFYNFNNIGNYGMVDYINPNDTLFLDAYFDLFGYISTLYQNDQNVLSNQIKIDIRLIINSSDFSKKTYSEVYSFLCEPLGSIDKEAFSFLVDKEEFPFRFSSSAYLEPARFLKDTEKTLLEGIIEGYPGSTFATISRLSIATMKSYEPLTVDNKSAIEELLADPLISPYNHIRLLAEELQQKINN